MATSCKAVDVPGPQDPVAQQAQAELNKTDYDFVEELSQDFFCPVTLELLVNPHQTACCGNHLSQEAVSRIQRDGKPCPMCKEPQLATMPDKFYRRRVNEIKVYCPHKKSGCEWVGEVNEVKKHSDSCPKRPFQCQYCEFKSTYDIGVNEHVPVCTKYPIVCPNCCEVGSVARCDLESHLMVCPLQPVTCEYAEVGCDVKVPRRDLDHHMKEGQQHHLMRATLLILRLTRENGEEKNKLLRIIEEKDRQMEQIIQEKDEAIANLHEQLKLEQNDLTQLAKQKDEIIAYLQRRFKQVQDELENLQNQVVKYGKDTQKHLKQQDSYLDRMMFGQPFQYNETYIQQGFSVHDFTLTEFKKCQDQGGGGNWYSEPFYSHPGGYKLKLNVETNGSDEDHGVYMRAYFQLLPGDYDSKLAWPVSTIAHVQILNQLGDHSHHQKTGLYLWKKIWRGLRGAEIKNFFKLCDLELNTEKSIQYLKNDCLKFRVYFKARNH